MEKKNSRSRTRKPTAYPAYMQTLHEAFKPLTRQTSTQWVGKFANRIAEAVSHMSEKAEPGGSGFLSRDAQHGFQVGRAEVLSLCLRTDEISRVLDLIEAILMGTGESADMLKIIGTACGKTVWSRRDGFGYRLREFVEETIEAGSGE